MEIVLALLLSIRFNGCVVLVKQLWGVLLQVVSKQTGIIGASLIFIDVEKACDYKQVLSGIGHRETAAEIYKKLVLTKAFWM